MIDFTNDEKISTFNKIAASYFNNNFGSMSKSDLETLLFSEYIEHCIKNGKNFDDYTLSKQLGITQSRIRSLKERKELKYPYKNFAWKTAFADSVKNAKYDENDHYVKFIIEDVNVMNEVRHYIEERGWYDECSLNRKLLRIPMDCFTEICMSDDTTNELFSEKVKNCIKEKMKNDGDIKTFLQDFTKEGLKSFLMSASKEAILLVLSLLPFGGVARTAFNAISHIIEGV